MTELYTPRLLLRRWREEDVSAMAEIEADTEVMQWVGDGSARDLEETAESVERWEEEWDHEGFGLFAVELLGSGELAGLTGLSVPHHLPEFRHQVQIEWRLGRQFWGQGYASEAAHATLEFALQDRGLEHVIGICRPQDTASGNVLRKLGMTLERETVDPRYGHPLWVHGIDLTEYAG